MENTGRKEVPSIARSSKPGLVGTYDKMKIKDGKRVAEEDLLAGHRMRMN